MSLSPAPLIAGMLDPSGHSVSASGQNHVCLKQLFKATVHYGKKSIFGIGSFHGESDDDFDYRYYENTVKTAGTPTANSGTTAGAPTANSGTSIGAPTVESSTTKPTMDDVVLIDRKDASEKTMCIDDDNEIV